MNGSRSELDRLLKEREELKKAIQRERAEYRWGLGAKIGQRSLQMRFPIHSGWISLGYIAFNIVAFVAGVIMIFHKGEFRDLGTAIIVGSLFSVGSFMAQWWTVQTQFELEFRDRISGSIGVQQHLGEKWSRLSKQIDELSQPDSRIE